MAISWLSLLIILAQWYYFVMICPWKRAGPFIWTNLNPHHPRMLCAKFGWNWPSGSGDEDENVKSLRQRRQQWQWRLTTDKLWSENLTWAFGSGELKMQLTCSPTSLNCMRAFIDINVPVLKMYSTYVIYLRHCWMWYTPAVEKYLLYMTYWYTYLTHLCYIWLTHTWHTCVIYDLHILDTPVLYMTYTY